MRSPSAPLPKLSDLPVVDYGTQGTIFGIDENRVVKVSRGGEDHDLDQAIERRIYERLGEHPRIVRLFSVERQGLALERLEISLRRKLIALREEQKVVPETCALKWANQITEGLAHLHEKGVLQVDMGCHNILLDSKQNLKLCDFAGSSIDGEVETVVPSCRSQDPTASCDHPYTVRHELFALGSALYEVSTTLQPFADKTPREVQKLFASEVFPAVDELFLGDVIQRCWDRQYLDAREVEMALKRITVPR